MEFNMKLTITKEKWIKWEPIANLAPKYDMESISDNNNELIVILSEIKNKKNILKIIFDHSAWSFKVADESFRIKTITDLSKKYGGEFYGKWTFFKIENSKYLSWLSEESETIINDLKTTHFALITDDSLIDIIASYEPTFELIEKE